MSKNAKPQPADETAETLVTTPDGAAPAETDHAALTAEIDRLNAVCAEHEKINTEMLAERDILLARVAVRGSSPDLRSPAVAGVAVAATCKLSIGHRKFTAGDPIGIVILEEGVTLLGLAGAVYAGRAKAVKVDGTVDGADEEK